MRRLLEYHAGHRLIGPLDLRHAEVCRVPIGGPVEISEGNDKMSSWNGYAAMNRGSFAISRYRSAVRRAPSIAAVFGWSAAFAAPSLLEL